MSGARSWGLWRTRPPHERSPNRKQFTWLVKRWSRRTALMCVQRGGPPHGAVDSRSR